MAHRGCERVGWLSVAAALAIGCGGKVEGEDDLAAGADAGVADGGARAGSGRAAQPKGPCKTPYPGPRPEYPYCYAAEGPPCLMVSDPALSSRLPGVSATRGPWVAGDDATCSMLCCYGS